VAGEASEKRVWRPGERFGLRNARGMLVLDEASANYLNAVVAELRRRSPLSATPPMTADEGSDGRSIGVSLPRKIFARLVGVTNPYDFVEVEWDPGTDAWIDGGGFETGTANAYESNLLDGLDGKKTFLDWEETSADWRFHWVAPEIDCIYRICPYLYNTCFPPLQTPSGTMKVSQGATVYGTLTSSTAVTTLRLEAQGAGYTNGTGYALSFSGGGGSGAAGTFDVISGLVTNVVLTAGGTGYTTGPLVSISAAGAGNGQAKVRAFIGGFGCVEVPGDGTYDVTFSSSGYPDVVQSVVIDHCGDWPVNFAVALTTLCVQYSHCGTNSLSGQSVTVVINGTITWTGTTGDDGIVCFPDPIRVGSTLDITMVHNGMTETQSGVVVTTPCVPVTIGFFGQSMLCGQAGCSVLGTWQRNLPGVVVEFTDVTTGTVLGSCTTLDRETDFTLSFCCLDWGYDIPIDHFFVASFTVNGYTRWSGPDQGCSANLGAVFDGSYNPPFDPYRECQCDSPFAWPFHCH
jgi:hypothetical protein